MGAGKFCLIATGEFGAPSYTPGVQTPFSTSRLEVGWTLIAAKYDLAPRTARRYALTYSDTLFRLRGRRLAHSGKGRSLMFTADDWALYQTLHDPRTVTGPGDVAAAMVNYFVEVDLTGTPGAGLVELTREVRAEVQSLTELVEEQGRALAEQTKVIAALGEKLAEATAVLDHLSKGVNILAETALER